ncbi:MAG: SMI1/KNR4 family protein [Spirochaetes bacterium]|nr:SMI1/KNR4 family protein [Spirochaetota bacterium]
MDINQVITELKSLKEEVPNPPRLPSNDEVEKIEKYFNLSLPPDYKKYLIEASDVVYGLLEPAVAIEEFDEMYLINFVEEAWNQAGVPKKLFPFCMDNGNYYCFNDNHDVVFWDHNGISDEKWNDFAEWVKLVWIEQG